MPDLHVLFLTERWPPDRGGMSQSCDRIVRGLRQRGVEVDVAVFSRRHTREAVETMERGRLLVSPADEDPGHAIQRLWNLLAIGCDLPSLSHVVAFGGLLPVLAAPAFAAWIERPLVTLLRGNDFDTGWFSPRRGDALRDAVARSACVCTVSRDHHRKLARLVPSARIVRVPNGIDAEQWRLTDADRGAARAWRERTVAPARRVLGLFGDLKQKKGAASFLEVLRESGDGSRVHLLIVGDAEPGFRAELESANDEIAHTFVAPVDRWQLLPYYEACDLVVIPSLYDGLPNVLLEAGALGVPAVASTAGGLDDLVTDGENAFAFAPGDRHGCRRAISRAVDAPAAELRAMGERMRARVESEFTARAEAEGYVHVLTTSLLAPGALTSSAAPAPSTRIGVGAREMDR